MSRNRIKELYVVVTCTGVLNDFPPAVALVTNLIENGYRVSLLACGVQDCIPQKIRTNPKFEFVCLGGRGGSLFDRMGMLYIVPHMIRTFLKERRDEIDVVWTTMAIDVRDAGEILGDFIHVMQIAELTEKVPAFLHTNRPPFSKKTIRLARGADRVVVPEYNRAFIQQTLWRLPVTPAVLPNKSSIEKNVKLDSLPDDKIAAKFISERRKIILYQGLFAEDRNLFPFADAVDSLGDEYVLYLMGKASDDVQQKKLNELISSHVNIEYVGFVPAPNHLAYTRFASIGLLPYSPSYDGACPPLNALYCAPNKIWEYSYYGVPMVGSDIPGLTGMFSRFKCGRTVSSDPKKIAETILEVDSLSKTMSEGALNLYESIDPRMIVKEIIEEVTKNVFPK